MKKLLLLLLTTTIYADDLDLGDDFSTGETVTAEKFNSKFNKLNSILGTVKDSDILGSWACTSYKIAFDAEYADGSHKIEGGGNGQVGSGYFYSRSGTITFSELNQEPSLNSPKQWSASTDDLLEDSGNNSGTYSLLLNKLHIFYLDSSENLQHGAKFFIERISENTITLNATRETNSSFYANPNIICIKNTD